MNPRNPQVYIFSSQMNKRKYRETKQYKLRCQIKVHVEFVCNKKKFRMQLARDITLHNDNKFPSCWATAHTYYRWLKAEYFHF